MKTIKNNDPELQVNDPEIQVKKVSKQLNYQNVIFHDPLPVVKHGAFYILRV